MFGVIKLKAYFIFVPLGSHVKKVLVWFWDHSEIAENKSDLPDNLQILLVLRFRQWHHFYFAYVRTLQ